jgi:hypothetical protein
MKRSGFAQPPRKPAKQTTCSARPKPPAPSLAVLVADGKARMCTPIPKADVLRADAYLRLVASLPCAWCGVEGYSQAAHGNTGKSMGAKTSDSTAMPLCSARPGIAGCHALLDQGGVLRKDQRRELEALWANQTRMKLRQMAAGDAAVRAVVERSIGL